MKTLDMFVSTSSFVRYSVLRFHLLFYIQWRVQHAYKYQSNLQLIDSFDAAIEKMKKKTMNILLSICSGLFIMFPTRYFNTSFPMFSILKKVYSSSVDSSRWAAFSSKVLRVSRITQSNMSPPPAPAASCASSSS